MKVFFAHENAFEHLGSLSPKTCTQKPTKKLWCRTEIMWCFV